MSFNKARYNKISIIFVPNIQYIHTTSGSKEKSLQEIKIVPQQIKEVIIEKSYETGLTDIFVTFDNMDPTALANLAEGKYLVYLFISSFDINEGTEQGASLLNYFLCKDIRYLDTNRLYGGSYMTVEAKVRLVSILRARLEIENNIVYELGGKGNTTSTGIMSAAGAGQNPYTFWTTDFTNLFNQNYSDRDGTAGSGSTISMSLTSSTNSIVQSAPPQGYLMNCDTNLEAIQYIHDHYPLFKTPYTWVIDDFNTAKNGGDASVLALLDLVQYQTWAGSVSEGLSSLFNKNETDIGDMGALGSYAFLDLQPSYRSSYFNTFNFLVRDKYPKIFAQDIASGEPIIMSEWNALHENRYMLVSSSMGLKTKLMSNPMYKTFRTFMPPNEISELQTYFSVFENLHPTLEGYIFRNAQIGDVDLNHVIEIKKESIPEEINYGYDRIGVGFQARHVYTRVNRLPPGFDGKTYSPEQFLDDPSQTPVYTLESEVTFLFIDKGPSTIAEYENQGSNIVDQEYTITSADVASLVGLNADGCSITSSDGTITGATGSGDSLPNNSSIGDQAQNIVDNWGCLYKYGGCNCDAVKKLDCSCLVQHAVRAAGADKGFPERFPRTTATQRIWLEKYAAKVSPGNYRRGDIIFFYPPNWHHVAVMADESSIYEASTSSKPPPQQVLHQSLARKKKPFLVYRIKQNVQSDNTSTQSSAGGVKVGG